MRSQSTMQEKFKENIDSLHYKSLYVASIFENLDQNNEKFIGFKKLLNQIPEYDEQEIMQILYEINQNVNYDRISEAEFFQLYSKLNLIPQNFEKNQTPFTFVSNKGLALAHKNFPETKDITEIVDDLDIIKYLSENGYGLDAIKNQKLMLAKKNNQPLRRVSPDLWQWIQQFKEEQILHSNSQTRQNPQPSLEMNNILDIMSNIDSTVFNKKVYYHHRLYEGKERIQFLKIFKWASLPLPISQADQGLMNFYQHLSQLESDGQHFRAAAIATFHFEFGRALECLSNAQHDESENQNRLMKNVFQALKVMQTNIQNDNYIKSRLEIHHQSNSSKDYAEQDVSNEDITRAKNCNFIGNPQSTELSNNFKNIQNNEIRYQIIQNELNFISTLLKEATFSNPYLAAMAKFLCNENVSDVVKEIFNIEGLEIFDKIAFGLRFIDDETLVTYFTKLVEKAQVEGILESLILVGKDQRAINIIQAFIDNTRDIQTTGLVSAHLMMHKYEPKDTLQQWYKNYKNLLNNMNMYEKRNSLDKEFKSLCAQFKIELESSKSQFQKSKIYLECKQCNNCLDNKTQLDNIIRRKNPRGYAALVQVLKPMIGVCPSCCVMLPVCCVCLLSCELINPYIQFNRNRQQQNQMGGQFDNLNLEEGIVWCQSCNHGGHYKHILEWFQEFDICPVSDCSCKCSML